MVSSHMEDDGGLVTRDTGLTVRGLQACQSYAFAVSVVGPVGFGPASEPATVETKYSPGAPPRDLKVRKDNN